MIDTIYFFASKTDICNIFHEIEQQFDIKYCMTEADREAGRGEMPQMEFDTIDEIADDCHAAHSIQPFYLIAPKTQTMKRYRQALKDRDDIERYRMIYTENGNSVMLKGMRKHEDLTYDYYIHIARNLETEFSGELFKKLVREVKKNCVRIKYNTPIYIGKDMYRSKEEFVFSGERCGCFTLTETDEVKEWYRSPKVREFADKPFEEQLFFLRDVFCGKELKDYRDEEKNFTEDYQNYRVAMSGLWDIRDLSRFKNVFELFNDETRVPSPMAMTAMEYLCEACVYAASRQKPDGIGILLEYLHDIPEKGYHCGCEGIVRILSKKKYRERFQESLAGASEDTQVLVKKILSGIKGDGAIAAAPL
ncbi:hypothetical protein D7X98_05915 [bacterium 1XD8-76]|nr:hypothetical protein D7X98_05915 [bacterium 1XD8-76]